MKIAFKNFPLPSHKFAFPAALAALAAHEQGKFWEFHDRLFAAGRDLDIQKVEAIAREIGLDLNRFKQDMANPAIRQRVIADVEAGRGAGVSGTPTIFINGHRLKQRSPEAMQEIINQELAKTK